MTPIRNCPDCNAKPGQIHMPGCDVEICSVCGTQRLQCVCDKHDPMFSRWSGWWPGSLESETLGIDMNQFYIENYNKILFIKPDINYDPEYSILDWQDEVAGGLTRMGYLHWVETCVERDQK